MFAPEEQIAYFGGDYDNFTYPRWNFDITFFRAYENGQPAKTAHYLKWSKAGASEGELIFTPGYPGSTARLLTVAQLKYQRDAGNPIQMQVWTSRRDALARYAALGAEQARRSSAARLGLENSIKRLVGQQDGLLNPRIFRKKEDDEAALRAKVAANPEWQKAYAPAWDQIAAAYAGPAGLREAPRPSRTSRRPALAGMASTIVRYGDEIPEAERAAVPRVHRRAPRGPEVHAVLVRARLRRHGRGAARGVARRRAEGAGRGRSVRQGRPGRPDAGRAGDGR